MAVAVLVAVAVIVAVVFISVSAGVGSVGCGLGQPNQKCSSTPETNAQFRACSFCGHDSVAVLLGSTLSLKEHTGPQPPRKQVSLCNPMSVQTTPAP